MGWRLTTEEFIKRAKVIHGDKYDYSLVDYNHCETNVKIICTKHGIFEKTLKSHVNKMQGCPICVGKGRGSKERFVNNAKRIHGDMYDYSHVKYVNSETKVKIICSEHGIFLQQPNNHLCGKGCKFCDNKKKSLTTEQFIEKAKQVHLNEYQYSLVDYKNSYTNVNIICEKHGIFKQRAQSHLDGSGCPQCKIKSRGELFIANWLNQNETNFEVQKSFDDCKNTLPLRYDFYLPNKNMLIEYDGEPHFREIEYLGGKRGFELRRKNDKIKTEYALINNINLLRIPHTERKNLSDILNNNINT